MRFVDDQDEEEFEMVQKISDAGWYLISDWPISNGVVLEFQKGQQTYYVDNAEKRKPSGPNRKEVLRQFLSNIAAESKD
jgi:hypothetical protein